MSRVPGSFLAMAAWAAATPLDEDQAGGEDGGLGMQIFEAGLQVAPDERGMSGDFHKTTGMPTVHVITDMYYYLSDKATKIDGAKKYLLRAAGMKVAES